MKKITLIHWCTLIIVITAFTGISQYFGLLNRLYEMGKDDTNWLKYQILVEGIHAFGILACCVLFFLLAKNARNRKVFVFENERLLMAFGGVVLFLGLNAVFFTELFDVNPLTNNTSTILMLMGLAFVFFSLIFKIGRKLKEEQELTI